MIYRVDDAGRAFLTREEGEVLHAYRCAAGVLTIGVGHTGPDVHEHQVITHERSQALLSADLARFELAVSHLVTVPLNQHQVNALVSFAFNLGEGALAKSSLLRALNNGLLKLHPDLAKGFFSVWCKVNGHPNADILARRTREAALFLS